MAVSASPLLAQRTQAHHLNLDLAQTVVARRSAGSKVTLSPITVIHAESVAEEWVPDLFVLLTPAHLSSELKLKQSHKPR